MSQQLYFRNKITFLNVCLTIMIVILHAKSPERFGLHVEEYPFIYGITMLCWTATPLFFFISSLLFFKGCTFDDLERKYRSRIKSLLVPYLLWNTIFVSFFWIMSHVSFLSNKMNIGDILNSPIDIIIAILNSHHTDLWFVWNLMCYTLLAPVLLLCFTNKRLSIILLITSIVSALYIEPEYKELLRWFPVYLMGAMSGYYWNDKYIGYIVREKHSPLFNICAILLLLISYAFSMYYQTDKYLLYLSPLIIWIIVDGLMYRFICEFKIKEWMGYMFFIFCTHHFFLNVIQKFVVLSCPPTADVIYLTYFLSPIVTIIFLINVGRWLKRFKFYRLLSGGR